MAKKFGGLGKGLDKIFTETGIGEWSAPADPTTVSTVRLSDIEPDRDQPRKTFDQEALQALADRSFTIEAEEFFLPESKSPVKSASGSYVSMLGNKGTIRFSRNVFPREVWRRLNIEDDAAEITEMERKKNGDRQFYLKIAGPQAGEEREIILTLYKDTNKCHARVNYYQGGHLFDFTGYVYRQVE